ncbi:MAG: type II secretion system GspH family protein [Puniceicoccales bacterium]|nr:type II secretion system GspH family protein [Puniceicoccales bacterium]
MLHVYFTKRQNDKTTKRQNVRNVKIKNQSFTLLEIVFTITIIGILLAICLPAMSAIKLSAQKVKDVSNLQTIAAAWRECIINRGWNIDAKETQNAVLKFSVFVERLGGRDFGKKAIDMVLNNPNVYISPGDKYASKILKESLTCVTNESISYLNEWWQSASNFMVSADCFFSYCLVTGLPAYVPLDTTPFGFTRGLRADGKWDEKAGLYGSKGGYVIYCDGHIVWFDGSKPAKFLHWNGQEYTSDIRQAVPSSAFITCGNQGTKTDYKSDGKSADQLVILYHVGTGGN